MSDTGFDVQGFARDIHELLVLSALRAGPLHGYQIAVDVSSQSDGMFTLNHGTLYPILHRLEARGLIEGSWGREGGRRRKVYTLTRSGARHLSGEAGRVEQIMTGLLRLLRGPGEVGA